MAENKNKGFISQMLQQYGEEWIVSLRPEDIQRNAKRISKDMTKGNINYEQQGRFFLDRKFIENLIIGLRNELEINSLNYNACVFQQTYQQQIYPNSILHPNMGEHIQHLKAVCTIYQTIIDRLEAVKETGNIGYFADLSGILYAYRQHLNY